MREFELSDPLQRKINKLYKKDRVTYEALMSKIDEIVNSPDLEHYKNLRSNMKDSKRVHIGPFVLVFRYVGNKVYFDDFDHHDKIY
ncbi:MAG: hypothetical protein V1663_05030 [archaeon]